MRWNFIDDLARVILWKRHYILYLACTSSRPDNLKEAQQIVGTDLDSNHVNLSYSWSISLFWKKSRQQKLMKNFPACKSLEHWYTRDE